MCDTFRPFYSADIIALEPNGQPADDAQVFKSVPLPVNFSGMERGHFGFPEPGSLVEIAFAYGQPEQVYIRQVLPQFHSLPELQPGETVTADGPGIEERTDTNGNKSRTTHGNITDTSQNHTIKTIGAFLESQTEKKEISQHSIEEIAGIKLIEALGAIKLLSAGGFNISSADSLNLTTATDLGTTVAGDLLERCGNISDRLAKTKQIVKVQDGGKVWLGNETDNALKLLSDLTQLVADMATVIATHNHPSVGACSQGAAFVAHNLHATQLKTKLDLFTE